MQSSSGIFILNGVFTIVVLTKFLLIAGFLHYSESNQKKKEDNNKWNKMHSPFQALTDPLSFHIIFLKFSFTGSTSKSLNSRFFFYQILAGWCKNVRAFQLSTKIKIQIFVLIANWNRQRRKDKVLFVLDFLTLVFVWRNIFFLMIFQRVRPSLLIIWMFYRMCGILFVYYCCCCCCCISCNLISFAITYPCS